MVTRYQEQFDRLQRSYNRFQDINDGRPHSRQSDYYTDDMYSFFMNCYHLKDWLVNDAEFSASSADLEGFINSNKELQLCADICNAQKHLLLTNRRSNENPSLGQRLNKLLLGGGEPKISVTFMINTSSGQIDAFELATKCIELWRQFIVNRD